jgi:hypothetical protein
MPLGEPNLFAEKKALLFVGREDFLWISCFLESVTLINMMRGDISFMKEEQLLLLIPPLRIKITNHVGK